MTQLDRIAELAREAIGHLGHMDRVALMMSSPGRVANCRTRMVAELLREIVYLCDDSEVKALLAPDLGGEG